MQEFVLEAAIQMLFARAILQARRLTICVRRQHTQISDKYNSEIQNYALSQVGNLANIRSHTHHPPVASMESAARGLAGGCVGGDEGTGGDDCT